MGTDIHLYVERRKADGAWERVNPGAWKCPWCSGAGHYEGRPAEQCAWCEGRGQTEREYRNRNYDLFGMLADVRNGSGFAGCDTGDGFVPLAPDRGLPDDLSPELRRAAEQAEEEDGAEDDIWLGDHSFTWCSLAEVLAYDYERVTKQRGVVDSARYVEWVEHGRKGSPSRYSGGVGGRDVVLVSNAEMQELVASGDAPSKLPPGADPDWERAVAADGRTTYYTTVEWEESYRDAAGKAWFDFLEACRALGDPDRIRLVMGFDS